MTKADISYLVRKQGSSTWVSGSQSEQFVVLIHFVLPGLPLFWIEIGQWPWGPSSYLHSFKELEEMFVESNFSWTNNFLKKCFLICFCEKKKKKESNFT